MKEGSREEKKRRENENTKKMSGRKKERQKKKKKEKRKKERSDNLCVFVMIKGVFHSFLIFDNVKYFFCPCLCIRATYNQIYTGFSIR